jgi:hypothetical protein
MEVAVNIRFVAFVICRDGLEEAAAFISKRGNFFPYSALLSDRQTHLLLLLLVATL